MSDQPNKPTPFEEGFKDETPWVNWPVYWAVVLALLTMAALAKPVLWLVDNFF